VQAAPKPQSVDVSGRKSAKMMMTMTSSQSKLLLQLNKFYNERVQSRRASVTKNMRDVCSVVQDVLKEVETQEPRFVSSLSEINGHYEGLQVCIFHGFLAFESNRCAATLHLILILLILYARQMRILMLIK